MSEWNEKILNELVEVDPEQLPSSTDANYSFYYIDISSVSFGKINFPGNPIRYKESPSRARKILIDNDILMSTVRPNLKAFAKLKKRSKNNYIASTGFAVLRAKKNTDPGFIYHSLFSHEIEKQIETLVVGSNYPAINSGDVKKLKIHVPFFSTQQKISHILDICDTVIEKTQSALAKYKAIKQGMLQDLFARGLNAKGHLRPTCQDAPELYKESELGMIPEEWEVQEFKHYFNYISYGFTNPMPECQEGPYMITAANVNCGRIDYLLARKTSQKLYNTVLTDKSRPKIGDLLLTKDGTLGRVAIVDRENICINQSVAVIRFNDVKRSSFFKILLETPIYQKKMLYDAGGSTIKHIYITVVDKMLVAIPQNSWEIDMITNRILSINNNILNEETLLQKYQSIKKGLMSDLLGGGRDAMHGVSTVNGITNMNCVSAINGFPDIVEPTKNE